MSNRIQWDPLLVRSVAAELDRELRGRACAAAPLFTSGRAGLLALDGGRALRLDLHPLRGWIRILPEGEPGDELDGICLGVKAPPDERRLEIRLQATDRFRGGERRLVVELHGNQWNAVLVAEEDQRILSILWSRTAGQRMLRTGQVYRPPAGAPRLGATELDAEREWAAWETAIGGALPERRRAALLRHFAWTGSVNAEWVLGDAARGDDADALRTSFQRWRSLAEMDKTEPVLLGHAAGRQPYPVPLGGMHREPAPSLLAAMDRVAADAEEASETAAPASPLAERARRRAAAAQRRCERLRAELDAAPDPERPRMYGDLLLAHYGAVPRGAAEVRLPDWEGVEVTIALEPELSLADNAARWYQQARRAERAREQLPALIEAAQQEAERWAAVPGLLERGEAVPEDLRRALEGEEETGGGGAEAGASRPFRLYRTSGGLEVRVGRSAKENDRVTFAHSRPDDIWLHARSVPGSHVILRWPDAEAGPPARDLEEAATLAALYSKARTSALVPVDYTRRKHVRKPRGAPPGAVTLQRAKTLFVEPDPQLEEQLRAE